MYSTFTKLAYFQIFFNEKFKVWSKCGEYDIFFFNLAQ